MISEDANFTTIDLTDFYLGTDLLHPEYIRIPIRLIPSRPLTSTTSKRSSPRMLSSAPSIKPITAYLKPVH
jgi:hypothetical protein